MANVNISNLPVAVSLSGDEYFPLVQGGTTMRATVSLVEGFGDGTTNQTANTVYAGPTTGASAAPTFRALVAADIPANHAITVGTTTVASGTTTRVLYDNAGVLGEYSISGSGSVAMTTSPTFVTPTLGVATATSINGLTLTASTGTLTITNLKTLSVSNTLTFTGTDSSSVAFGTGGTVLYTTSTIPLTVGTTTIASGTTTRVLYDNAGVLGEYAQVPIANGGTNGATATAGFDNLAPTTTRGDLIFRNATINTRLAASTSGYLLQTNGAGTDPTWEGFLQAGTGATTRTWLAKNRDVVSLVDFGAVGNGVTSDAAAWQAVIDNYPSANIEVIVPPGTYTCPTSKTLPFNVNLNFLPGATMVAGHSLTSRNYQISYGSGFITSDPSFGMPNSASSFVFDEITGTSDHVGGSREQAVHKWLLYGKQDGTANPGAGVYNGRFETYKFGSLGGKGGYVGLAGYSQLITGDATDSQPDNVGMVGFAFAGTNANYGGGSGTEKGAIYGGNMFARMASGATFFNNCTSTEFNVYVATGASVRYKSGLQIANYCDVRGTAYDAAIAVSSATAVAAGKWGHGILFGNMNGQDAFDSTSTVIGSTGSDTVTNGLDLSSYTISGSFLKGPAVSFSVGGDGYLAVSYNAIAPPTLSGAIFNFAGFDGANCVGVMQGFAAFPSLVLRRADTTAASPSAVQLDEPIGQIAWRGYGATAYSGNNGSIRGIAAENWTDSVQGVYLSFSVTPKGSAAAASEVARISDVGNVKLGGSAVRGTTEGTKQLVLFDGTAPVGTLTNGISFYSASGEARVMDAAGNSTLLSPHDKETNEWVYHSVDTNTGKGLRIDMERMLRAINERFGWDFVHEFEV